jgi:hypothetical protein
MYSAVDLILSFLFFTKIRIHVAKANGRKIKSPAIPKNNEAFWKRAEDGTRTRDPNLGKVMLYQLSYFRKILFAQTCVLEAGLEPAQPQWPKDFKSFVSTDSTIRASLSLKR